MADTNRDGFIQYSEFCRAIRSLSQDGFPVGQLPDVSNVSPPELSKYLERLFQIGDKNGDGVLSPSEFETLLRKSGFNFDNMTIRRIMNAVDTNKDGVIQYDEFVPAIMALLRSRARQAEGSVMPDFRS